MQEPLAFRVRPTSLDEVVGQVHLVGEGSFLRKSVESKSLFSMIFFGPPGTGKTTIAEAYAKSMKVHFVSLNAVTCTKKDMEAAVGEAKIWHPCIVIVDEVHRLDKAKQDYLLPYVENGTFFLIGATTANPYISLNRAIRSRTKLLEVKPLTDKEIASGLKRAVSSEKGLHGSIAFEDEALLYIGKLSGGDMRFALNVLEEASVLYRGKDVVTKEDVAAIESVPNYASDKDENEHYDTVSALQKSIRGRDVDAALYYLAKLCASGDLDSIKRRLLVTAYEDVGLGNPNAVMRAQMAIEAAEQVGFPEAVIPLGNAVIDLCLSPHSRVGADSIESAMAFAESQGMGIRDYLRYTPVNMKEEDKYPYDRPDLWARMTYLPEGLENKRFYLEENSPEGSYLKALNQNYELLKKTSRRSDLARLKKEK